jgi:hypothetical protein
VTSHVGSSCRAGADSGVGANRQELFHGAQIHPSACSVDQRLKHLIHAPADREYEIPALLQLVVGILIAKPAALLLVEIEGEAQTGRIHPTLAGLAQPPYRPVVGQGVCDPREACELRDVRETVSLLGEPDASLAGRTGDPFMAVEDHLGGEWGMGRK